MTFHFQKRHETCRVAQSERDISLFAADKQAVSRVTHTLAHARAHAVNDRTDMPRRGQLEPAAQAALELLRNPAGGGFKTFHHLQFRRNALEPLGGSSPRPEGPEGAFMVVAAKPLLIYE